MNAMSRRVRRLEQRLMPPDDPESWRLVAEFQARLRCYAEEKGEKYEPPPPEEYGGMGIVEILRSRFRKMEHRASRLRCSSDGK